MMFAKIMKMFNANEFYLNLKNRILKYDFFFIINKMKTKDFLGNII
ncbi:hypothetical protein SXY01_22420 [Staphylococcus xylosus]|nr:hypothetical protein SXY01_22420 [Staphylococcus xylosus]